jgi:hypothetical protein
MRRRAETMASYSGGKGHYRWKDVKMAASDMKSWVHGVIQICVVTILYGMAPFFVYCSLLGDGFVGRGFVL